MEGGWSRGNREGKGGLLRRRRWCAVDENYEGQPSHDGMIG